METAEIFSYSHKDARVGINRDWKFGGTGSVHFSQSFDPDFLKWPE